MKNKCPKFNEVNYGASTSGINSSAEPNQESGETNNQRDTKTTQNQAKSTANNKAKHIPLLPERIAYEQILWLNKMYAIRMAKYWKS